MSCPVIQYSQDWNNKLQCPIHTTIRMSNAAKYQVGKTYEERLHGAHYNHVVLVQRKVFTLGQLTPAMAMLDTGYPLDDALQMLRTMYKNRCPGTSLDKQRFMFLVLVDKRYYKAHFVKKQAALPL